MVQTDEAIQTFLTNMNAVGTANSTAIILTAKHGQNPLNPAEVCRPRLLASLDSHAC
jgi:membrane-anchored protein YejM (alkaline phosphatase superfamily)